MSDVRMAGMSGIDLAHEARKRRPALRIILTSGYEVDRPASFRFLQKPWRGRELMELLGALDAP